jgi:hypothetical protein
LNTQKFDARLIQKINSARDDERLDIFIHCKNPPQENSLTFENLKNFDIRGLNGKKKILTGSLTVNEIEIVSEMGEVVAITQSTQKYPVR